MELLQYAIIGWIILAGIFALIMYVEPRTLWSGAIFCVMALWVTMMIGIGAAAYGEWLSKHSVIVGILLVLMVIAVMMVAFFPLLLILTFLIQGIKVMKHEGVRPTNALSLLFAVGLIAYLFIWPRIGNLSFNSVGTTVYVVISWLVIYLLFIMAMYALSSVINLVHIRKNHHLDYIVVLGCGVIGDRVTPLLAGRIEKGIELLRKNPSAKIIMSGGQGPGENLPEGEAMAKYAIAKGVDKERIIVENKSVNTRENLLFSKALMEGDKPKIALVTTSYHVFRALMLARQCSLRCVGFGAKTKWYFTLNAVLREFVGYLSMTWKRHAAAAGTVSGLIILVNILDAIVKLR